MARSERRHPPHLAEIVRIHRDDERGDSAGLQARKGGVDRAFVMRRQDVQPLSDRLRGALGPDPFGLDSACRHVVPLRSADCLD